jgi:ubiquinone/menaquinone biosynthesis C-methylase UbiE
VASLLHARADTPELLDGDRLDPAELSLNLREMATLNRLPGGMDRSVGAVARLLGEAGGGAPLSVLDVGTGAGDFARRLLRRTPVRVTVVDLRDEVLRIAGRNLRGTQGVTLLRADARQLPFPDAAFDVAHASLLLHHFDPGDAITALRELRRVARLGVVINDLRRGRLAFLVTAVTVLSAAGLSLVERSAPAWPRVTSVYR